ncbi:hypothetical protein [Thalassotalea mangrovi]|uniref:Lipoprotein n=1 Tax=Thalassotalea mangrovi TaxID=2572245 RepID=A0A4V5NUN4_9GAMM|nr:hypothetical protein [Thalassotalea mangrovi]TKB46126.1 hypothetical protein E8M12_05730 [Thalassotalea mangrovi]
MKFNQIWVLLFLIVLSGCTTSTQNKVPTLLSSDPSIDSKHYLSHVPVYVEVKRDEAGTYYFGNYSFKRGFDAIKLNDLSHTFSTRVNDCAAGMLPIEQIKNCDLERALFRKKKVDADDIGKNILGNIVFGSLTLGAGVAAYYTTEFDQEAFNREVTILLHKFDRKAFFERLQAQLADNHSQLQLANDRLIEKAQLLNASIGTRVSVRDDSGLLNKIPSVKVVLASPISGEIDYDFSWSEFEEFQHESKRQIDTLISGGMLKIECEDLNSYEYDVTGCEQEWRVQENTNIDSVTYQITAARNYQFHIAPKVIDKNISIRRGENSSNIELENLSEHFITLNSLSLYIGDKNETINHLNITLPPRGHFNRLTLDDFRLYSQETIVSSATKSKLLKPVQFGFAAKYSLNHESNEETVFQLQTRFSRLQGVAL